MATLKPPTAEKETHLRIRVPERTKKWLAHQAVDHGVSQQEMALQILEAAMASMPRSPASKNHK